MRTKYRILVLCLLTLVSLVVTGCSGCPSSASGNGTGSSPGSGSVQGTSTCGSTGGGGGGGTTFAALLYYIGAGGSSVQAASLTTAGVFANLSPFTPPTLPGSPVNSMVIAKQQFLYVPVGGLSQVQAFSINPTSGALTAISGSPYTAQAAADTVTTDPGGRFLFVGGRFSNAISVYQIDPTDGTLTLTPGSPFTSFDVAFSSSLTVEASGQFLYVGQTFSTNPVVVFSINQSTGALTEIAGSPFQLGVSVLQADPTAEFLLGIADSTGASGDAHIHVFSINGTTGMPTAVVGSPFATVNTPFGLTVQPSGNFVYPSVADSSDAVTSLEGYQLNPTTGALTAISGSPFTSLPSVSGCQFDQSGVYAFCMNTGGFSVLTTNISTGALSHVIPDLATSSNFPFAPTD
jgi:6-phosphogluconolactonase